MNFHKFYLTICSIFIFKPPNKNEVSGGFSNISANISARGPWAGAYSTRADIGSGARRLYVSAVAPSVSLKVKLDWKMCC